MKRSILYTAVFSAMMMVTGCGGGESNSTNDVTTQISEKRDLTYTTDEDGNYYLDFSEMKSDAKAIIQTSGKFYTYDEYRKEGTYGDQDGIKTYYNEKNIINFEYLANNVVKADIFDRKNGFVKRVFTVIRNGELYAQETTDVDVINIDESKPLILHSGVINEINKIIDVVDPLPTTASSTLAKGINFSFFPTAYAAGYGVAERTYRNDRLGAAFGIIAIGFALGELAVAGTAAATFIAFPVILPVAIGVLGTIALYENNEKFRNFLDNTFDDLKKGPTNLLNNLVNVLIPNANASEEEIKYWKKLLEEERKKCLASGMKLINGICKKEEEPQCLADEILVNGICKKKEPVCAQDEVLDNGKCIKSPVIKDDFTKISSTGQKLSRWGSVEWDCVLDNKTGLMWEKKTEDGKLRDYHHQYSYYYYDKDQGSFGNEDPQDYYDAVKMEINGIPVHYPYGYHCGNTLEKCNTHAFVQAVNKQKLCGYSDWRLPNDEELTNLGRKQSTRVDFFDDNDGDHWVQGESIVYLFLGDPSPYPNKAKNSVRVVRTENK